MKNQVKKMPKIVLTEKTPIVKPSIPIEADIISPDNFVNKKLTEIGKLTVWRGNKEICLEEVFDLTGDEFTGESIADISIVLEGEKLSRFKRVGQSMTAGHITINGSIGMHVGFQMVAGEIIVNGDADDFAGAKMEGGSLQIKGNVGHYLGGSTRGDWRGMSGGIIKVKGDVKNECGVWMRNGLIEIQGDVTIFLGMHLHRGTIIVKGNVEERAGAEMTGGTIVIQGQLNKNLPSFLFAGEKTDPELEDYGVIKGTYLEFSGDHAERKQGTLFLLKSKNKHLVK
ncbi:MAG: formylmethanofuran dehydrogenase subunit C [Asgard group archaeon]|nr:formylmethanofuran dehydrogenase subunit C [Asgard group archaeon]